MTNALKKQSLMSTSWKVLDTVRAAGGRVLLKAVAKQVRLSTADVRVAITNQPSLSVEVCEKSHGGTLPGGMQVRQAWVVERT